MRNQQRTSATAPSPNADYYTEQYNARAKIPDHPQIFTRWQKESALVRRTQAGLLDLRFGNADKERLDFYPAYRTGQPLLVFIHGGWWRSLDKSDFTFVVPAYRRAGFNVALTNYTLAPEATIDEITMQQVHAMAWLYRNAEHLEFDRNRIVVAGHSAGGHLASMMMAAHWPAVDAGLPPDLVKGGVLMSGLYDLDPVCHADFVNVDLKLDAERALKLSPARMPHANPAPFITAVGDLESDEFKRQTALIASEWKAGFQKEIPLSGFNHLTICDAFADPSHPLSIATCELLAKA